MSEHKNEHMLKLMKKCEKCGNKAWRTYDDYCLSCNAKRIGETPKSQRKKGRYKGQGRNSHRKPTKRPTLYLPGTEGKIRVLTERAKRGEHLFHAQDATTNES